MINAKLLDTFSPQNILAPDMSPSGKKPAADMAPSGKKLRCIHRRLKAVPRHHFEHSFPRIRTSGEPGPVSERFRLGNENYPNNHEISPSTNSNYAEPHFDSNHFPQLFQSPDLLARSTPVPFEDHSVDVYTRPSTYDSNDAYHENNNSVYNGGSSGVIASSYNNLQNNFQWQEENLVHEYNTPEIYASGYTSAGFYTPASVAPTLEETCGFSLPPGYNPLPASGFEIPAGVPRNSNFSYPSGYEVVDEAEVFEECVEAVEAGDEVTEEAGVVYYKFTPNSMNANPRGT